MPTYMLKKLPLLPPCSAAERSPLALNFSHKLLRKLNFSFLLKMFTFIFFHPSSIGDIFGFMLTGGALQSCFIVGAVRRIIFILLYYESVLCDTSYVLCSIMHSSHLLPLSLTIQISHHQLRIILFLSDY